MTGMLIVTACVLLFLAAHPFTTYQLSLRALERWRPRPTGDGVPGAVPQSVALCVCAYNEERVIRSKIENMIALRATLPGLELLVYVDGSSDRTAAIVREYGDRVRLVASADRLGKTHGMNTLVGMTKADIVVFSDANVVFAPDAVPRLVEAFADPGVGCVCGHLVYSGAAASGTAATGSLYWRIEEMIKTYESATGSVMGADGSIFALRRSLHVPPPPDLIDDMFVSFSILCAGHRIVRVDDAFAYEEAVSRPGEDYRRRVRISCQAFNVHRVLRSRLRRMPWLDRYKYVSHKLLRWLTIFLLAGAAVSAEAALAVMFDWRVWLGVPVAAVLGALAVAVAPTGPLATLRDAMGAFVAAGVGVLQSLQGQRFQTWVPPASSRDVPAE